MKNELFVSNKIDPIRINEMEDGKIRLTLISSKICEIKNIAKTTNETEIEYFTEMLEILVKDKLVFLNYNYS